MEKGQSLVEYALILVLVAIIVIVAIGVLAVLIFAIGLLISTLLSSGAEGMLLALFPV